MSSFPWSRAGALFGLAVSAGFAGVDSREAGLLRRFVSDPVPDGPCTRIGADGGTTPEAAALWNGVLIHCADYDDTHQASVIHPSAVVLPATLATAEAHDRTIGELLQAYALGCESLIRLGLAAPGEFHAHGFHATAVCGPVGAAVGAGLAAGEPAEVIDAAASVAATAGGGTFEYINTGGNSKVLYPGLAARGGLDALRAARAGFRPPAGALTGRFGLAAVHTGILPGPGFAPLVLAPEEPGDGWRFVETAVKSAPCCYFSQVFIDALSSLRDQVDFTQVDRIECTGPGEMLDSIFEPRELRQRPEDPYDAKFALPFQLATVVRRGAVTVETFQPDRLADQVVTELARNVTARPTAELGPYPEVMAGRVEVFAGQVSLGRAELSASIGAGRWELDSSFVVDRLERDLGPRGRELIDVLAQLDAPVTRLSEVLRSWAAAPRETRRLIQGIG